MIRNQVDDGMKVELAKSAAWPVRLLVSCGSFAKVHPSSTASLRINFSCFALSIAIRASILLVWLTANIIPEAEL